MKFFAFVKPLSLTIVFLFPLSLLAASTGMPMIRRNLSARLRNPSKVAFLGLLATKLSPVVGSQLGFLANLYLSVAMVNPTVRPTRLA